VAGKLRSLEAQARRDGAVLAIGSARRDTIDQLVAWTRELEARGLALTPISGLVDCTGLCDERRRKAMAIGAR
ncbi:MAG TPA: divergent polysaccharide deacetylase family protein, partial [Vineibacter sp.]|nr:divergent polysaccharide deacetylase family protein [Vineibacter sp.]